MKTLIKKATLYFSSIFTILLLSISNFSDAQLFIVGDTLSPSITYSNLQDTSLPFIIKGYSEFDIDIDFDNINDLRFYREHSSSPAFLSETFSVYSLNTIQFVCDTSFIDADTLPFGTIVGENQNWNNNYNGAFFYYYFESYIPPPWGPPSTSHGICKNEDIYIGFRKIGQLDTLYGWFNIDLLQPFTIKSFAVNKTFNTGIFSNKFHFSVYPNPSRNKLVIENINEFQGEFLILLIDSQGRRIINRTIGNYRYLSLDLSEFKNGMYFLLIKNNNKRFVKKIIIN